MADFPEKIGKYEIRAIAGRGNMGVVYFGYDPFADRDVAIKVCSVGNEMSISNNLARKMFFNEAHTAGALDHPNILKVFDGGDEKGDPYIVMEHVEGTRTLKSHCEPENLLPIKTVVELIYKCAKALDYAHRRGVIHRDIKPTNIMLTPEEDVKIGDFGIAQRSHSDTTQVMGMIGSPRYLSPEQAREDTITNQSDLFSLGVVLFELLCGRPPFVAQGFSRLINKILHEEPPLLRELRVDVPPALEEIVQRALQKDPEHRYKSGRELASDLARVFGDLDEPETDLPDDAKFAVLRQLSFFNPFSDPEVWEVIRASTWETYSLGERILVEGSLEHSFFIIVQGEVSVAKGDKVISTLSKGDCFGEMGHLSKIRRTASIAAKEDEVRLLKINSTLLDQASLTCQLRFNQVFLQTLVERLARTSERLSRYVD